MYLTRSKRYAKRCKAGLQGWSMNENGPRIYPHRNKKLSRQLYKDFLGS